MDEFLRVGRGSCVFEVVKVQSGLPCDSDEAPTTYRMHRKGGMRGMPLYSFDTWDIYFDYTFNRFIFNAYFPVISLHCHLEPMSSIPFFLYVCVFLLFAVLMSWSHVFNLRSTRNNSLDRVKYWNSNNIFQITTSTSRLILLSIVNRLLDWEIMILSFGWYLCIKNIDLGSLYIWWIALTYVCGVLGKYTYQINVCYLAIR